MNEEIGYDKEGNNITIIDVLKTVSADKVSFSFVNASQPVLIEPAGETVYKYVIMPMRA